MENLKTFNTWYGNNGMDEYIKEKLGCSVYTGQGITHRTEQKTTILRSVDNTYFYADDLSNPKLVMYTLFGHNGDQDPAEKRYNEKLINPKKSEHIYLYRVCGEKKEKRWIWYGKYRLISMGKKQHPGKDQNLRKIIILGLEKI